MNMKLYNNSKISKSSNKNKIWIIIPIICFVIAMLILIPIGHNEATMRFNSFTGDVLKLILDGYDCENVTEKLYNARESVEKCKIYSIFMSREQRKEYKALREFIKDYPLEGVEKCLLQCDEFEETLVTYNESANSINEILDNALEHEQRVSLNNIKSAVCDWESALLEVEEFLENILETDTISITAQDMEYSVEFLKGLTGKMEEAGLDEYYSIRIIDLYRYSSTNYESVLKFNMDVQHYKTNNIIYSDRGYLNLGDYCCFEAIEDYCKYNKIDLEMNTIQCSTLNRAFIYKEIAPLMEKLSVDIYLEEYLSDYQYSGEYSED